MIVKTSSQLKVISGIAILSLLSLVVFFYTSTRVPELSCAADVRINMSSNEPAANISGMVHMVFHLVPGARSYVSEYGVLTIGNDKYKVDRNARLIFGRKQQNGYSEVQREGVDKNKSDTLPDAIAEKMTSSQAVFFFKIDKLRDGIWRISDLRRTIIVCKDNN